MSTAEKLRGIRPRRTREQLGSYWPAQLDSKFVNLEDTSSDLVLCKKTAQIRDAAVIYRWLFAACKESVMELQLEPKAVMLPTVEARLIHSCLADAETT